MVNFDLRINYVRLLQKLIVEAGERRIDCSKLSDYQLLQAINTYLKYHNCITYTVIEMNEIASNMN